MELRRSRGFTLIELLIALGLSTVGLLGLMALQIVAIRGNVASRAFSEATAIAQSQIEQAERTPYASLSALVEGSCAVYTASTAPNCTGAPAGNVSPYTRCTAVAVDAVNGVTTVQVSVCWQDTSGAAHALTMYTKRAP